MGMNREFCNRGMRRAGLVGKARVLREFPGPASERASGERIMPPDGQFAPTRTRSAIPLGLSLLLSTTWSCAVAADGKRSIADGNTQGIPQSIRPAVIRALPLLVKASADEYPRHRDCFSCHNQAVPALALSLARQRGF